MSGYSIGEVARLAGVTVRTLHHYDRIGLLTPSGRTVSGYRRYDDADLDRLWRIRIYGELDVPLREIAGLLDGDVDPDDHLRRQHELLRARRQRLDRIIEVLERTMEARKMGINLTADEMFEVFGDVDPGGYADEAKQRWGDTDAWKQSQRRTSAYTKDDWLAIQQEAAAINAAFITALTDGVAADSDGAMDIAESHRMHISRWFYDCPASMHRHLGEMSVQDARFTAHYEEQADGLARFVRDAVVANADRVADA
jgi:MerR family transcriptional regulator, thiopeptide resistance regulator